MGQTNRDLSISGQPRLTRVSTESDKVPSPHGAAGVLPLSTAGSWLRPDLYRFDLALTIRTTLYDARAAQHLPNAGQGMRSQVRCYVDHGDAGQGHGVRIREDEVGVAVAVGIDAFHRSDYARSADATHELRWTGRVLDLGPRSGFSLLRARRPLFYGGGCPTGSGRRFTVVVAARGDERGERRRSEGYSRMAGNSTTSRRLLAPVSSITSRSIPRPTPPVGGIPDSSASM